ncbi:hypothetical protein AB0P40_02205 [Streptomyces sp. NPDC079189]|uniref:hypothetical protein n=1 Tax=Streptomyces sp. NPDC079189 TaxID=3154514 RepID=UPI0034487C52
MSCASSLRHSFPHVFFALVPSNCFSVQTFCVSVGAATEAPAKDRLNEPERATAAMARLMLIILYERHRAHHVTGLARQSAPGARTFEKGVLALKQFMRERNGWGLWGA